jgi:hypothetical protein
LGFSSLHDMENAAPSNAPLSPISSSRANEAREILQTERSYLAMLDAMASDGCFFPPLSHIRIFFRSCDDSFDAFAVLRQCSLALLWLSVAYIMRISAYLMISMSYLCLWCSSLLSFLLICLFRSMCTWSRWSQCSARMSTRHSVAT